MQEFWECCKYIFIPIAIFSIIIGAIETLIEYQLGEDAANKFHLMFGAFMFGAAICFYIFICYFIPNTRSM